MHTRQQISALRAAVGVFFWPLLLAVFCGIFPLVVFVRALFLSNAGEVAAALGGVIGGIAGAGGAVGAVFLALSRQREEETAKVAASVATEIATLVKYVIGAIEICSNICRGFQIPLQDARNIAATLLSDPVVYPAVADRVGLLPHPEETTEFYMRISEVKSILEILSTASIPPSGTTNVTPPKEFVRVETAKTVAESLITAMLLARVILDSENIIQRSQLTAMARVEIVRQIDECLKAAHAAFPEAESIKL